MQNCIRCDTPTELYVFDDPMCPKCSAKLEEERAKQWEGKTDLAMSGRSHGGEQSGENRQG
jgi:uncharacterized paraquat-inducible protein A